MFADANTQRKKFSDKIFKIDIFNTWRASKGRDGRRMWGTHLKRFSGKVGTDKKCQ